MISARDLATGDEHEGVTVQVIAERLFGRGVELVAEHDEDPHPPETTYLVMRPNPHVPRAMDVLGRLRAVGAPSTHFSTLPGLAAAWREALEIADAHRDRLRAAMREDIEAGMPRQDAARLAGVSRVTANEWLRQLTDEPPPPGYP